MSKYIITNIIFLVLLLSVVVVFGISIVSFYWFLGLLVAYLVVNLIGSFYLAAGFFLPTIAKGSTSKNAISITFDDGPIEGKTEKILDVLNQHQVKATFFCIGHRIQQQSTLASRIHNEGHLLGNHSFWHKVTFDWQTAKNISQELNDTDAAIRSVTGRNPLLFRPPFGVTNPMVAKAARQGNYTVVGWSIRSFDTAIKSKAKLLQRITRKLTPGAVVVFHDYSDTMIEALPDFIRAVSAAGLKIVKLDELLDVKAYE